MDLAGRVITILAVVVVALTTHFTNHLLERQRMRHLLLIRLGRAKA
ncbi:hypothetical protein ACFXGM_07155 [Streptomyces albidoflavus]